MKMKTFKIKNSRIHANFRRFFDVYACVMAFTALPSFYSASSWADADCLACSRKELELTKNSSGLKQHEDLLVKNKDYLSKINVDTYASQAIKVKSNILVIVLRIDTFKNNIDVLKKELAVPDCKSCQVKTVARTL